MPSQLPDIPKWAARQIEEGLIKDKLIVQESDKTRELSSVEIRNTLMFIKLDALRGFFQNIAEAKNERSHTAYDISLYQTALIQIGVGVLVIDGVYKDSKKPKSNTEDLIADFQERNHIRRDGKPGKQTARKIVEALDTMIAAMPKKTEVKQGDKQLARGPHVSTVPISGPSEFQITFPEVPELQIGDISTRPSSPLGVPAMIPIRSSQRPTAEEERQIIIDGLVKKKSPPGFFRGFVDGISGNPKK